MPQAIVKYKNKKALDALIDLSKRFDISIELPKRQKVSQIKGVSIIQADDSIDTKALEDIFSRQPIDATQLREEAWQRKK